MQPSPRRDCPKSCPLYSFAESLWKKAQSSGKDPQKIIDALRTPSNAGPMVAYRERQSDVLSKVELIESCLYYPESDITIHPEI